MQKAANVVVVGGGVMGVSCAYHLAKRGVRDILLLEKESFFGTGSTGRCAGGIRHQFSSDVNIELAKLSLPMLWRFEEVMGQAIDLKMHGYMMLLSSEQEVEVFRGSLELQNRHGIASRLLSRAEVEARVPDLNPEGVVGATFCEQDGTADPSGVVAGYVKGARALGVELRNDAEVTALLVDDGDGRGSRRLRPEETAGVWDAAKYLSVGQGGADVVGEEMGGKTAAGKTAAAADHIRHVAGGDVGKIAAANHIPHVAPPERIVTGVALADGSEVRANLVLNAAGAWAGALAGTGGFELPIWPERQQIVVTNAIPNLPRDFPFVIDFRQRLYFHQEGRGLLTGQSIVGAPPTFSEEVDEDWTAFHLENATDRLPSLLEDASIKTQWAGLYENTPDAQAIMGPVGAGGFHVIAGFSGHGFMFGPVGGLLVAEQILDGKAISVDVTEAMSPTRFLGKEISREVNII